MRPSSRTLVIDAALLAYRSAQGTEVSMDALARLAGITKKGVLYHFPTKSDLRAAVGQHVAGLWHAAIEAELGGPLLASPVSRRILAFARVAARGPLFEGEAAVRAELLSRGDPSEHWLTGLLSWFAVPSSAPAAERIRCRTAILAADGLRASQLGPRPLTDAEARETVGEIAALLAG